MNIFDISLFFDRVSISLDSRAVVFPRDWLNDWFARSNETGFKWSNWNESAFPSWNVWKMSENVGKCLFDGGKSSQVL